MVGVVNGIIHNENTFDRTRSSLNENHCNIDSRSGSRIWSRFGSQCFSLSTIVIFTISQRYRVYRDVFEGSFLEGGDGKGSTPIEKKVVKQYII